MRKYNKYDKTAIQAAIIAEMKTKKISFVDLMPVCGKDRSTISRAVNIPTEKIIMIDQILNFLQLEIRPKEPPK